MIEDINLFKESKREKLKRLPVLRVFNAIGMIAWRVDRYNHADQRLRMLHPLSWVWLVGSIIFYTISYGVVEVRKEIKNLLKDECVWW